MLGRDLSWLIYRNTVNILTLPKPRSCISVYTAKGCKAAISLSNRKFSSESSADEVPNENGRIQKLYKIEDYEDYIYTRILDHNGGKLTFLQRILPVEHMHDALTIIHDYFGTSWSTTVVIFTIFLKITMLPVWAAAERARRKNAYLLPEALELQEKAKIAYSTGNTQLALDVQGKLYHQMSRKEFIKGAIVQILATCSQLLTFTWVYGGLKLFAIKPKENLGFALESPLWLDSLALPDPCYIFPAILGALMIIIYEHNKDTAAKLRERCKSDKENAMAAKQQKQQFYFDLFSRCGIIVFAMCSCTMTASTFFYLIPSFLFQALLRYSCNKFLVAHFFNFPVPTIGHDKIHIGGR